MRHVLVAATEGEKPLPRSLHVTPDPLAFDLILCAVVCVTIYLLRDEVGGTASNPETTARAQAHQAECGVHLCLRDSTIHLVPNRCPPFKLSNDLAQLDSSRTSMGMILL